MEEEIRTGFYLQQTLIEKGVKKGDITSLISFVLAVPEEEYEEGFIMSSDVRFALNGMKEAYTALSRKYEPTIEYVLFNSLIQKDIFHSLQKLAGKRKNPQDSRTIEALLENIMIERFRTKIDDEMKLDDGSLVGQCRRRSPSKIRNE